MRKILFSSLLLTLLSFHVSAQNGKAAKPTAPVKKSSSTQLPGDADRQSSKMDDFKTRTTQPHKIQKIKRAN